MDLAKAVLQRVDSLCFNVKSFGAKGKGTTNDGPSINAAIEAAYSAGGGRVYVPEGYYAHTTPIVPKPYVSIFGAGRKTILQPVGNFKAIYSTENLTYIKLSHFAIDCQNLTGDAIRLFIGYSVLDRIWIYNCANINTGISINDPNTYDYGLALLNIVKWCNIGDPQYGIKVFYKCADSWFLFNNIGSSIANVQAGGGPFRFIGNHLDGDPQYNFYGTGGQNLMLANNLCEGAKLHSLYLPHQSWDTYEDGWVIDGNIIRSGSRDTEGTYDFIHMEGSESASGKNVAITGNTFTYTSGNKTRYAIYAKYFEDVAISGNCFDSRSYTNHPVGLDVGANNIKITGNTNNKYALLNSAAPIINGQTSGTAIVPNGSTSIDVAHGLGATPDIQNINITPTNSLGSATKFWVSSVSSTTFTITVDTDPGIDTATFGWKASV